ncbi:MAG TPA: hypothetical protein V6C81_12695 [Planktothrix sp.]|jgi:hypothetical protein
MSHATSIALLPENLGDLIATGTVAELIQCRELFRDRALALIKTLKRDSAEVQAIQVVSVGLDSLLLSSVIGGPHYPVSTSFVLPGKVGDDPEGLVGVARLVFDEWTRALGERGQVSFLKHGKSNEGIDLYQINVLFM